MTELTWAGIAELGPRLRGGTLSPVELCQALLTRVERLEPRLNAFITLDPQRILDEAREVEAEIRTGRVRGPLHGVPIAVKDLCWTRGQRTTAGSKVLADFVPTEDATVVARLRRAGAVVFGKTNTPEFAYGPLNAYHYGPSHNPWDLDRFTGGSSMGAAAVLAAGLAPGALGSDTGGSIRGPAHWSGVTGLKPTWGRVPLKGVAALATSLDHVGPMTRSAEDAALLLSVMAGHDPDDPTSADVAVPDYGLELRKPVHGLRLGVLRGPLWEGLPGDIAAPVSAALGELERLGMVPEEVRLPGWEEAVEAVSLLISCEAAAEYRTVLAERPDDLLDEVRERLLAGRATPAPDYVDARRAAARVGDVLRRVFARVDVLALPARDQPAPRMEPGGRILVPRSPRNYLSPFNAVGVPALVVPCGFVAEAGRPLPVGLQLVARHWEDGLVLRVGHALQQVTDWHRRRPPLAA